MAPAGCDDGGPDWEGKDLIGAGLAIEADAMDPEPEPESPLEDLKSAAVEYADSEAEAEQPEAEPEAEAGVELQDTAGPPKPAATKQEWIDWAVSQGAEWIAATNSTKQQLMEQYGQRA